MRILFLFFLISAFIYNVFAELSVINGERLSNELYKAGKVFELSESQKYIRNKIYIKTYSGYETSNILGALINAIDHEIRYPFAKYTKNDIRLKNNDLNRIAEIKFSGNIDVISICNKLNNDPRIEYAMPEFIHKFRYKPNDEQFAAQHYLQLIEAESAWDIQTGSDEILIAIVDSGVDALHEDLRDNIWENPGEIAGNGIDDDDNGFVDDIRGWDFIGDITQQEAYQSKWQEDNNVTPKYSSNWHGTHVAGIAAATANNSIGIAGASFNCKILPVKVSTDNIDPNNGGVNATLRGYEGILYAAVMGADIINVSWGTYGYNPLEEDILNQAIAYGSLIVAAVGNDEKHLEAGSGDYPAMYPNVVAVGATNTNGNLSNYSNDGIPVDVFAPGNSILSAKPLDYYDTESGTSMATPLTAGIAALIKANNTGLNYKQLHHKLRSTSRIFGENQMRNKNFYGVLNAKNALEHNTPGISVSEVAMTYQYGFINNYDGNRFVFEFTNYLDIAESVSIKVTAKDNRLDTAQIFNFAKIKSGETVQLQYDFALRNDFPWYYSRIPFEIEIIADNYHDFELIEQTVLMPSYNQFRVVQEFDGFNIDWRDSHSPEMDDFWAVGYDNQENAGVLLSHYNHTTEFLKIEPFDPNSIYANSEGEAFLTTNNGMVLKTDTRGEKFFILNQDYILSEHIYADDEIFFIGTNENNERKLVKTINNNWQEIFDIGEDFKTIEYYHNNILIVENDGENMLWYFSKNAGENFDTIDFKNEIIQINVPFMYDIEFINNEVVAFSTFIEGNGNITYFVNLTNKIPDESYYKNLSNDHVLYSPDDSRQLFAMNSDLSALQLLEDTKNLLSFEHDPAQTFSGVDECGRTRIWNLGKDLAYLEFDHMPHNLVKDIRLNSKEMIEFDTLNIDESDNDFVMLNNNGNFRSIFESIEIEGSNAFKFDSDIPFSIMGCEFESFFVKFEPKKEGLHEAEIIIRSDSEPEEIKVALIGYATDPASVYEKETVEIYPNPAIDEINIALGSPYPKEVKLFDQTGKKIKINYSIGQEKLTINTSELQSGIYNILLIYGNSAKSLKFAVVK